MKLTISKHIFYLFIVFLSLLIGSCQSAEKNIRKGDNAYAIGEYAEAAHYYKRAYSMTPSKNRTLRGQLSWKQGQAYWHISNIARARGAYLNAQRYHYADTLLPLRLSSCERMMNNAHAAAVTLDKALAQDTLKDSSWHEMLERSKENVVATEHFKQQKSMYKVQAMPLLQSERSDYSACYIPPEQHQIVFTSTRRKAMGDEVSGITDMKAGDLFASKLNEKKQWTLPEPLKGINTKDDEGACCFSSDGKTMFFTRCVMHDRYPRMAEICVSQRNKASWSKPTVLRITADSLSSYAHPAVSPDGQWLYFVSDMLGGYGGLDLWRIRLKGTTVSGAVENLGAEINTKGNEMFPTFRYNGDLYYSSDGRYPNYGGLDIYRIPSALLMSEEERAKQKEDMPYMPMLAVQKDWGVVKKTLKIEHMPYPINSQGNDFGLSFKGHTTEGLFTSSRSTHGRGWDKIYQFSYPASLLKMRGWVYEQDGYELPAAEVYVIGSDGTNKKLSVRANGSFDMDLEPGVNYMYLATCKGFLNHLDTLHLDTLRADALKGVKEYTLQFPLANIHHPVLVRGIFYKFDDAQISDSSRTALDRLATLLKQNPNVAIELAAHTDARGREEYNQRLSQRRAESVVRYLTEKGIDAHRMKAIGYGEARPMVVTKKLHEQFAFLGVGDTLTEHYIERLPEAEREIAHALNRRTAFSVLQTSFGLFDEKGRLKLRNRKGEMKE